MFKDLFVAIAAGVIGALPVQPVPVVTVSSTTVESAVVTYIEAHEHRSVAVECDFTAAELSLKDKEPQEFVCLTTDKENKEKFQTHIVVASVDKKVDITAVIDKDVSAPSSTSEKK